MPQPSFIDSWIEPWRNTLFISRSHVKPNPTIRQHPATGLADPMVCTDSHGAGAVQWRSRRVVDLGGRRGSTGALWIQAEPRMDVGWYVMMNDNDGWGLVKQVGLEWRSWEINGNHDVCLTWRYFKNSRCNGDASNHYSIRVTGNPGHSRSLNLLNTYTFFPQRKATKLHIQIFQSILLLLKIWI